MPKNNKENYMQQIKVTHIRLGSLHRMVKAGIITKEEAREILKKAKLL